MSGGETDPPAVPVAIRENRWTVDAVRCMDCDTSFVPLRVDRDVNRQAGTGNRIGRLMLVVMPETCPRCHNLTAVPEPE